MCETGGGLLEGVANDPECIRQWRCPGCTSSSWHLVREEPSTPVARSQTVAQLALPPKKTPPPEAPPPRSNPSTNRPAAGPSSPASHHSRLNTRPTPCIRVSTEPPPLDPQNSTGGSQLSPEEGGADKCASYLERFYIQRRGAVHDRGSEVLQHSPKKYKSRRQKGGGVETGDHHQIINKNNNNNNNKKL